jgi:hypothetical protein
MKLSIALVGALCGTALAELPAIVAKVGMQSNATRIVLGQYDD